jgi:hypothetical protein
MRMDWSRKKEQVPHHDTKKPLKQYIVNKLLQESIAGHENVTDSDDEAEKGLQLVILEQCKQKKISKVGQSLRNITRHTMHCRDNFKTMRQVLSR